MSRKTLPYVLALLSLLIVLIVNAAYYAPYHTQLFPAGYLQTEKGDLRAADWSVPLVSDWNSDGKQDLIVGHNHIDKEGMNHGFVSLYAKVRGTHFLINKGYIQACMDTCQPIDVPAFG